VYVWNVYKNWSKEYTRSARRIAGAQGQGLGTRGLEKWDWLATDRAPEDSLQRLMAHPQLPQLQYRVVRGALAFAAANREFQSLAADAGSFFLCCVAIYMDCTGGLTHRRLRAMTGGSGLISAGRATALLWRLRAGGMIETAPDDSRRFVAAPAIRAIMRERLRVEFEPLSLLDPDTAPLMARFDTPGIFDALMIQLGEDLMGSAGRPDTRLQNMGRLLAHNCGIMILYALIDAMGEDTQFPPRGSARVSVSALARRFSLSRSHVLRVLRMLEEMGWLISEGDLRTLGPRLGAELRMFHALMALGALRAACRALRGPVPAPAAA